MNHFLGCCVFCSGVESPDLSAPSRGFFCGCTRCLASCSIHCCSSLSVLRPRGGGGAGAGAAGPQRP
jgi:hypothetical protein